MESSGPSDESAARGSTIRGKGPIHAAYHAFQEAVFTRAPGFALVEIEPTTRCGARCTFCPRDARRRPGGELTLHSARNIATALAPSAPTAVLLSGFGEPTLHPDLPGIVRALRPSLKTLIGVVTNGAGLTPDLAAALIDAGVDFFHVSVVAATVATAREVAPGLDFEAAERNLTALLAHTCGRTPVAINFVVTPANRAQKPEVERVWRARGVCALYASPMHNRGGFLIPAGAAAVPREDCWIYRHTLFVAWDGAVLACCHDLTAEVDYGNITRDTLAIVFARREARMRYTLAGIMCRRCDFYLA